MITQKEANRRLVEKHGKTIICKSSYCGGGKRHEFTCTKCNHVWSTSWNNVVWKGSRCPKCSRKKQGKQQKISKKLALQKIKDVHGNKIKCETPYKGVSQIHKFRCTKCNHTWKTYWSNVVYRKSGCFKCMYVNRTLTENEAKDKLRVAHADRIECFAPYTGANNRHEFKCKICKHKWITFWDSTVNGKKGCPACSKSKKYSKSSIECINAISKKSRLVFHHAENKGEVKIGDYFIDGYNKKHDIAIEFHGVYWHRYRDKGISYRRTILRDYMLKKAY